MTDTPKTEEPTYSAAFEAIKPELIAFLKDNLSIEINTSSYMDSSSVDVTLYLCGEQVGYSGASL